MVDWPWIWWRNEVNYLRVKKALKFRKQGYSLTKPSLVSWSISTDPGTNHALRKLKIAKINQHEGREGREGKERNWRFTKTHLCGVDSRVFCTLLVCSTRQKKIMIINLRNSARCFMKNKLKKNKKLTWNQTWRWRRSGVERTLNYYSEDKVGNSTRELCEK